MNPIDEKLDGNQFLVSFIEILPILIPYILGFFVFRGLYANFPIYIQLKLGLSEETTVEYWALISTVALFIGGILRIPAGIISDRIGRVRAFFLGYIAYIIALSILFLYDTLFSYIISISLIRSSLNLYAMSGRGIVSASEREKGFKNGLLSSMVGFGGLLGPLILALLLENYTPNSMITFTLVLILFDAFIFILALKFIPQIFKKKYKIDIELPLERIKSKQKNSLRYFKEFGVLKSIILFFSAGIVYGLITVIYTVYGYNILNMSIFSLGLIVGLGSLSNIIVAPITGMLYMQFKDENVRLFAWIGLLCASIIVSLGRISIVFFILGYFLMGFANSMFFTMEITRLGRIIQKDAFSIVFGTATTLVIIGSAISSSITKFLYSINSEATFYASFLLALITTIFLLSTHKKQST